MKGNKPGGFIGLSCGVLLAMAFSAVHAFRANACSVSGPGAERAVTPPPPAELVSIEPWVIYLLVVLVVVAVAVVIIVLLATRKRTGAGKKPTGMPPNTPPPVRPSIATPPGAVPQPSQPIVAGVPQPLQPAAGVARARLIMPDNTEVPLSEGMKYLGRNDFERMVPPDRASYVSRQHLAIGFSSGNYYIEDAGSGNGTKLNGRDLKGKGSQWLKDGDQVDVAGVAIFVFKTS